MTDPKSSAEAGPKFIEEKLLRVDEVIVSERQRSRINLAAGAETVKSSLKKVGVLIQSIAVDQNNKLLAGECRLEAFKQLGHEYIPARVIHCANDYERDLIEQQENDGRTNFSFGEAAEAQLRLEELGEKLFGSKWSQRKQAKEYGLSHETVSFRVNLAKANREHPELNLYECRTADEADKKYKKHRERRALDHLQGLIPEERQSFYQWAEERYLVGDALEGLECVEPGSVDFVEVDPPYAVDLKKRKGRNSADNTEEYTEWLIKEYRENMPRVAELCYRAMKPNTFGVFWYATMHHCMTLEILQNAFGKDKVNPVNAIWYKQNSPGQSDQPKVAFATTYEPFFLVRKGNPKFRVGKWGRPNVFAYDVVSPAMKRHPTQKPVDLLTEILERCAMPGANVLVPFLGSGVTLEAAYKLQMNAKGWDLDNKNRAAFLNSATVKDLQAWNAEDSSQ